MSAADRQDETLEPTVPCHVCGREVPRSEAVHPEGVDYALYFCGVDCVARWRQEQGSGEEPDAP